jgi:hypothetical protein
MMRHVPRAIYNAAAGGLALTMWLTVARPWMLAWGSTPDERYKTLPGDDIVARPDTVANRAITIKAATCDVWSWLIQMGQDRAGFYSYDWLESLFGARIHNADRIVPAWQSLNPGDLVRTYRYLEQLEPMGWIVDDIKVERHLVLRSPDGGYSVVFFVEPVGADAARLLVRSRSKAISRITLPFTYLVFEPAHFIMERGMLRGIRDRAEFYSARSFGC